MKKKPQRLLFYKDLFFPLKKVLTEIHLLSGSHIKFIYINPLFIHFTRNISLNYSLFTCATRLPVGNNYTEYLLKIA